MEDNLWTEKISVLFEKDKLLDFIPYPSMTKNEKLNAIIRFTILLSLLLIIIKNDSKYLSFIFVGLLGTYVYAHVLDKNETFVETEKSKESNDPIDFDFDLVLDNCKAPTKDNPFMNRTLDEPLNKLEKPCDYTEDVINKSTELFNENAEAQLENIYNPTINQRQFYTVPNNQATFDQKSFRDWLYKTPYACEDVEERGLQNISKGCDGLEGFSNWNSKETLSFQSLS